MDTFQKHLMNTLCFISNLLNPTRGREVVHGLNCFQNKPEYENIKNKITQFKESTKTRKNVFVTMVTTYGVTENANSLEVITNNLTMDCLFEED